MSGEAQMQFGTWLEQVLAAKADEPADYLRLSPEAELRYLRRMFAECGTLFADLPDETVGMGLWHVIDSGYCEATCHLKNTSVDWELRRDATLSITNVFADCFAKRPGLHRRAEETPTAGLEEPWRYTCFMWWDVFAGRDTSLKPNRLGRVQLSVLDSILRIECPECQLSALHGLGHFAQSGVGSEARRIIAEFLSSAEHLSPTVREYAIAAREGRVL